MSNKKKIALLNMRYDNNYGGNLQRYAMVTVLQRMGYSVEYLYIRDNWDDWFNHSVSKICKQSVKQFARHILHPKTEPWLVWHRESIKYREECKATEPFLEKYIPHTKVIYSHRELEQVFKKGTYDAILAGSDQIWRKKYVERYGLGTWYLDFVSANYGGSRVVYGASFGVDGLEYSIEDQAVIRPLYEKLTAVPPTALTATAIVRRIRTIQSGCFPIPILSSFVLGSMIKTDSPHSNNTIANALPYCGHITPRVKPRAPGATNIPSSSAFPELRFNVMTPPVT